MSLAQLRKLDDDGVTFQSHIDGSTHRLTPERSLEIQALLDSDIRMQLDECVALPADRAAIEKAMRLSLRWAQRSKAAFGATEGRALFGIVQGGDDAALRLESAAGLTAIGFDGYAIGGTRGRRTAGDDAGDARCDRAGAAGRCAALPDGRRHAGRHRPVGGARHRHVRLRAADARRPPRRCLHPLRQGQSQERTPRRRPAPARRGSGMERRTRPIRGRICTIS